jgi:hypothetical protein
MTEQVQDIEAQVLAGQSVTDPAQQQPAEQTQEWSPPEYLMLGEEKVPWDKAAIWLGQGRHYSQRGQQLNEREAQLNDMAKKFEGYDAYKPVADFVQNDPQGQQWWSHVQSQWENRHTYNQSEEIQQTVNPLHNEIQSLKQQIQDLAQFKQSVSEKEQDAQLNAEISSVKEKFGNVDWSAIDDTGLTLEQRVINHGVDKRHPGFRSAFLDYYHDNLMKMNQAAGTEAQAKAKQAQAKTGIIGKSSTPVTQVQKPENHRKLSYEDLTEQALKELGIR